MSGFWLRGWTRRCNCNCVNRWRLPQAVPAVAVIGLVSAPEDTSGSVAVLLAAGALPLTRAFGTIWVNRETSSTVRATVHSLLAQAERLGVTVCGLAIAAARFAGLPLALAACSLLLTITIVLVQRLGRSRTATPS